MWPVPAPGPRRASALPSVQARVLAFVCILVAGLAGAAIGGSVAKIECHGSCTTPTGLGAVAGGAAGAGGTAVVASLTLRAMGEWKRISDEELEAEGDDDPYPGGPPEPGGGGDGPARNGGGGDGPAQDGVSNRNPSA
jgi:hypothetical protein